MTRWSLPPCCCRFVRSWLVAGAARINSDKVVFRSRATGEGEVETAAGLDCANKPMLKTRTKTMTRTPQYARRVVVVIKQTPLCKRPDAVCQASVKGRDHKQLCSDTNRISAAKILESGHGSLDDEGV